MRILFMTTKNPTLQGDFLEVSILHGLRSLLGSKCFDVPRKKIMYHDWSETSRESLHGGGFTLYTTPIEDISSEQRANPGIFDILLYGCGHMYGEMPVCQGEDVWYLDGHDLYGNAPRMIMHNGERVIGTQFLQNCFKRELVEEGLEGVYPTGFGIPKQHIRDIDVSMKSQLIQSTAPSDASFQSSIDGRAGYEFTDEEEYFRDMQQSWFGLTCKKGGWDCLRHYEILAAGALLLFKDYDKKPPLCSPQDLPCYTYSTKEGLDYLTNNVLMTSGQPTAAYFDMLERQRNWLIQTGTTEARARAIIQTLEEAKNATV